MAVTPSTMLELGTKAPGFSLTDTADNTTVSLDDFTGRPLLVMFICNHCPFVKHVRAKLAELGRAYQDKGVGVVAISSNDVAAYPEDSPKNMKKEAAEAGYTFPYLYDETQEVAKVYRAACTPDFFLFDSDHRLAYRGQMDSSRPGNDAPITGNDLTAAVNAVLAGKSVNPEQKPSAGCNIKWKPGNAPNYSG
ncbi:MAG: thioredoxin family protein [Verrucomicrobia bacterium]|nr:thioredoxin family protein [Verrucomicrobiota bacterium]